MTNAIEPSEFLVLDPGARKVSFEKDTKMIDAGTFLIEKEDHTVGNVLRYQLLKDNNVLFAGYKMPHPLEHKILVKIQTTSESDPHDAMMKGLVTLKDNLFNLEQQFEKELEKVKPKESYADWPPAF
eukprot:CAMPEP_0201492200 /NCGR_PEP_ID=MMETSP0151_2-20130828/32155_1 /ASSEMBLY_ACC=CAM_ASM_000257 /TAXON_ID=200890 /ORGANISM="Paramoeba atlantica, Strain 621/1 / CCAP 1560/9" /LENGTH=126 /DNA_ID=CAMNT_0047878879 /DNA_START=43 /DNA_END=423 /DNA_ORIENTATION=-